MLATGCGSTGGQTGDEHTDQTGDEPTDTGDGSDVIEELKGTAQRLAVSGDLPNSASADGWSFGWKLYAEEADPASNTFFSPYSISVAASMLYAGAAGQTKAEMQSALDFSTDGEAFHQARNSVAQALESRNRTATVNQNGQTLRVVNDLWLDPMFRPLPAFLDTLSAHYGASAFLAPLQTDPEPARLAINDKVSRDTEGLIEDLLPENALNDSIFVLTNALFFKARWATEFDKLMTADAPFAAQSGQTVPVPMMHTLLLGGAGHVVSDEYTAISMPYDQQQLELVAIMPAAGTFDTFVAGLDAATVARIAGELEFGAVQLSFPKLSIEARVPLKERLIALGMQSAFVEGGADFSALTNGDIFISNTFHQATIGIDEEGTVAAAATAFVAVPTSAPSEITDIVFDRPFVFFVRDVETNALLFLGHFANP
jgi:serpin B